MTSRIIKSQWLLLYLILYGFIPSEAQIVRPIGTNLSSVQDWSTEYVFVDVFKQCRAWVPHEYGTGVPWSSTATIPLDSNGYPLEIPYNDGINPPLAVRTPIYGGPALNDLYPGGNYRLIAAGTGQIRLWGAATGTFTCPVDTLVMVDSSLGRIMLEIDTSISTDPVRNIRFIMPGFENSYASQPFNPKLLDFLNDFQTIRFMDWMETNNSPNVFWSDRNKPNYYSQTLDNGVAYEYIIQLCNLTQKDPWICIPHRANDQYITEMARLFRDALDPNLKIYIEYSNEVWNGVFAQRYYADSMGNALAYSGNPWEQSRKFYAKRTADVFRIFEHEFQGNSRLIKVIANQAANSWLTNYIIEQFNDSTYNPTQVQADVVAIAPYFAGRVANDIGNSGSINSVTVNDIIDSMELSLTLAYSWMDANKVVADTHNLELVAYEGGQHLRANSTYANDTAYVNKLTAANRHPRMQDLYCAYLDYWFDSTQAGIFCNYNSHGLYGRYGSWGVKEYMEDTLSPKYLGLQNCVFSYNIDTTVHLFSNKLPNQQQIKVYPIPSHNGLLQVEHQLERPTIRLYDAIGRPIHFKLTAKFQKAFTLNAFNYKGLAILTLYENDTFVHKKILFTN
ncbi:T9SS C-terminal target domain-containing protein [Aureispira anguillae]|uniref:T9SS C-terminal target domain-containing protein n=1 Tax=Aureispira anguillae TaxID=2864201 RepID=A0A915YCM5_9BACT|nr:T9SS C-terminal target domain-containing protein [Aureispira anguillae]BDS10623.1 T9SS C-terminal target domain-containing protein [Aureispira anguillae]